MASQIHWTVLVIDRRTKAVVHEVPVKGSMATAIRVERGMHINMDRERFRTEVQLIARAEGRTALQRNGET